MTGDQGSEQVVLLIGTDPGEIDALRKTAGPGFRFESASGVDDAIARTRTVALSLVLIDATGGTAAGFEACAGLRASHEGRDMPILVITPDDAVSIASAYESGATDYLTRPFNDRVVRHRIQNAIRTRAADQELRSRERRFRIAERLARTGHWSKEADGDAITCSDQIRSILGVGGEDVPRTLEALVAFTAPEDRPELTARLCAAVQDLRGFRLEHQILRRDGSRISVSHEVEHVRDDAGRPAGLVGTIQDITERKDAEQRIHELAYIDSVTDLPNRLYLLEHLKHVVERPAHDGSRTALLFIDLDDFKQVNDAMGHDAGDELLRRVARRLIANTRAADGIVRWQPPRGSDEIDASGQLVTRIGGDEFVVVQQGIKSIEDALSLGWRISALLAKPFVLSGRAAHVAASIGISVSPDHGVDVEKLLKNADAAMYQAKATRSGVQMFDDSIGRTITNRAVVGIDLRKAMDHHEIFLKYQPRVDLATGQVTGVEALARWRHPTKGIILPKDFIGVAEETGIIDALAEIIVDQACRQIRLWRAQGHRFVVSINVSSRQLRRTDLAGMLDRCVTRAGIPHAAIEVEIAESAMMKDVDLSAAVASQLRALGFSLSVDDFGTGYSSLHRLKKLPVTTLKLDRSFVGEMTTDADADSIVRTLVGLGRSLGLRTVAEGVETEEQVARLQRYGCDEAQGYFIARALAPEKLRDWLRAWTGLRIAHPTPH